MSYGTVQANAIQGSINTFSPNSAVFRNRIINGAMVIDQRNAGAEVNPAVSGDYYTDRWRVVSSAASKFKIGQNAGSVTSPAGFTNYLGATSLSAYTVGSGETYNIQQRIEGYNVADLDWGTANAKTVTLSFWVRSSLTGTFGGAIRNSAADRSYPYSYTISTANTWEYKTVTIAGDTSGTWLKTNGIGLQLIFGLGSGATRSGTAGAWAGTSYTNATGATSVVGTNGATWYITGVQLEVGESATGFDYRPYGTELALCQRYYYKVGPGPANARIMSGYAVSTTASDLLFALPVSMRDAPAALEQSGTAADYNTVYAGSNANCTSVPTYLSSSNISAGVRYTNSAVLTANGGVVGRLNANGYLAWSAEL
jgi:hypothetical protein